MDITSLDNKLVKHVTSLHLKKYRDKEGQFIIEGYNSLEDALASNFEIKNVLYCPDLVNVGQLNIPAVSVSKDILSKISDTVTPQGLIAVCSIPQNVTCPKNSNKILFLDRVQDPGNVGTLMRTADAMGFDAVVLSSGCADPYSLKVVRSTSGSIFHVPVIYNVDSVDFLSSLKRSGVCIYSSVLTNSISIENLSPILPFALVIGNEGQGVSDEIKSITDYFIKIDMLGKAESLNASIAAGILMYKFSQS